MPELPDIDREGEVLTESETKLEKPKLFKVLLHNDDFTTMEFVVFVLQYVFNKVDSEAIVIMLKVHNEGVGVAGIYPYEVAKTKAEKTTTPASNQPAQQGPISRPQPPAITTTAEPLTHYHRPQAP